MPHAALLPRCCPAHLSASSLPEQLQTSRPHMQLCSCVVQVIGSLVPEYQGDHSSPDCMCLSIKSRGRPRSLACTSVHSDAPPTACVSSCARFLYWPTLKAGAQCLHRHQAMWPRLALAGRFLRLQRQQSRAQILQGEQHPLGVRCPHRSLQQVLGRVVHSPPRGMCHLGPSYESGYLRVVLGHGVACSFGG